MRHQAIDVVYALLAGMLAVMAVFGLGPIIETRYFPVYSKFTIKSVERIPPNNSLVTASYTKYRDCPPLGAAWYNSPVQRDLESGRQLEYLPRRRVSDPVQASKPIGRWDSIPFELSASPEELSSTVFAEVFSRCHPFWTTRTLIYP